MKIGRATGLQVAFLSFAVMLLAAPIASAILRAAALEGTPRALVEKGAHFFLALILMVSIPPLRRGVIQMLATAVPRSMRLEVVAAILLKLAAGFGGMAALVLWLLAQGDPAWVQRMSRDVDRMVAAAYTGPGLVVLVLSSTIGPVVEEIVFRGFVYRAFERQWGWIVSLIATSALFGIYHPHFWTAFTGSVILVCLLRRTGSLRGLILVHMAYNFLLWPPLLGQYVLPRAGALTDPGNWFFHGLCLSIAVIAVPAYVWISRDRGASPTMLLEPHGALPK